MNDTNRSNFKKSATALAVASCLSLTPWLADAASLGKLTVLSGLGQPLRAELEIGASQEELAGMTARLAPQAIFRQAGVDYATTLFDLNFMLERRPDGRSVIKVTSHKPVNEPFLDFLVELNWPSGRLVREYTFLLDPPDFAGKSAAAPVADARVVNTARGGALNQRQARSVGTAAKATSAMPEKHVVQHGETLRQIAGDAKYDGVSLEQMLVGIFQKNPEAFAGDNMNRLKAGAILGMPAKSEVEAVSDTEAKRLYHAQAGDWHAYRAKLAAAAAKAPAEAEAPSQSSSGAISAKVEEKLAPAETSKDQVKVARTEQAAKAAAEAEKIASSKALKEADDRLALLEKNVAELQKLVELKNQQLAELQQRTAAQKEAVKPTEPPVPAQASKPAEPEKPTAEPAPTPEPAEKPAEAKPPVAAPKPPEAKPKPPATVAPPAVPEPGFLDSLLDNSIPLAGGGILALLLAYFLVKRRRGKDDSQETTAAPGPSSLGPNSVFRMTGGQSVDTGNTPPQTGDFSQTGPGTIDTDEVDPVAEADVYMAYGRDTQAEEILLEALQKDPQRTAIHAKLLEIYANRRSVKQFETLASELYAQTGGQGPDWAKVAVLGAGLDPENPLYSGAAFDADATMVASPESMGNMAAERGADVLQATESAVPYQPEMTEEPVRKAQPDISLELPTEEQAAPVEPERNETGLDFDLGAYEGPATEPEAATKDESDVETIVSVDANALDFDLGPQATEELGGARMETGQAEPEPEEAPLDFELNIPEDVPSGAPAGAEQQSALMEDEEKSPDFSPEGTLVMPGQMDEAASTYIGADRAAASTDIGVSLPGEPGDEEFKLDFDSSTTQTSVNATVGEQADEATRTVVNADAFNPASGVENPDLATTQVNPQATDEDSLDFDVKLTDSVFLGDQMMPPEFDIGSISLDLGAEPVAEPSSGEASEVTADASGNAVEEAVEPMSIGPETQPGEMEPGGDAHWEEVNTKLDLAKAYEEMGDLEGARELLQEVLGEGPADLVEQARSILDRIGE